MEITSSLLNDKIFRHVKSSLIKISEIDDKQDFRVRMLEYINDTADNNDDMFFYDMLEFVRFLKPSDESVAYTTPDGLIYLNSPGHIGEKVRHWDFIYCHECLHQLWETFAVGDKIKNEGIEYNHYLLNLASDCVINDYLAFYRSKSAPENLITPKSIKEDFGIEYDRKADTQYTLYLKMLEKKKEMLQDPKIQDMIKDMMDDEQKGQQGQGQQSDGDGHSSNNGTGGGSGNKSGKGGSDNDKDLTADDAQDAADKAKAAADKAQEAADKAKERASSEGTQESKDAADKAQDAADKAKAAADKAKAAADKAKGAANDGDSEGEHKYAKEAKDAAKEAQDAANKAQNAADGKSDEEGEEGDNSGNDVQDGGKGGSGNQAGKYSDPNDSEITDVDIEDIRKRHKDTITKYRNKLSGDIGQYLSQCKESVRLTPSGLGAETSSGKGSWHGKFKSAISSYVKMRVDKQRRQYEQTYTRMKRGSGYVGPGGILQQGKRVKDNKLNINASFYVDRSVSMSNRIDNAYDACYSIADSIKKLYGHNKVVGDIGFDMNVFNNYITKIAFGKREKVSGGTCDFHYILDDIEKKSVDYLLNIIITDAEFGVNEKEVTDLLKKIKGLVIFVTCEHNAEVERIANKPEYKTRLRYILADGDFTLKN